MALPTDRVPSRSVAIPRSSGVNSFLARPLCALPGSSSSPRRSGLQAANEIQNIEPVSPRPLRGLSGDLLLSTAINRGHDPARLGARRDLCGMQRCGFGERRLAPPNQRAETQRGARRGPSVPVSPDPPHLARDAPRPWRRPLSLGAARTICGGSDRNALPIRAGSCPLFVAPDKSYSPKAREASGRNAVDFDFSRIGDRKKARAAGVAKRGLQSRTSFAARRPLLRE